MRRKPSSVSPTPLSPRRIGPEDRQADLAVIVPTYNAAAFLDQTLASVAAQTVRPRMVVVADDCSLDNTGDVARAWQDRLPLSVLQLEQNLGPGGARHKAIVSTNTSLIALLDHDDYWFPHHLESMLTWYGSCRGIVSALALEWIEHHSIVIPRGLPRPLPSVELQLTALLERNYVSASALFSRELYDRVGGFRSDFRGTEDWDLWIRMVRSGAHVVRVPHYTLLHRLSQTSLSSSTEPATELRFVAQELAVLATAAAESSSPRERKAVRRGLRHLGAKQHYFISRALALDGRLGKARIAAFGGLLGDGSIALRSAAIAMAPGLAIRRRQARADLRKAQQA
jgi:GT2 family glycosyltransferase